MHEVTQTQVEADIEQGEKYVVYFFSPFCGTCHKAEKILETLEELDLNETIVKANIQLMPWIAPVKSVPALVVFKHQKIQEIRYQMGPITELKEWFDEVVAPL
ncbi:thioredoxin family protein [Salsuginibacillus kocurii]|uniref:thioredoxin family protein n=1 Tax=Salsuginibacillus kocurii TaxID=427078 RepID=UPI00036C1FC6|nr:thioredoxin family protein [Salsuginibacillus kocurii]